jgi:RHS repeat-associated protein
VVIPDALACSYSPAAAAAAVTTSACGVTETRVGGIDLSVRTGIGGVEATSSGTHPGIGYCYGETVVDRLEQYDERLLGPLGLQGPYYNWSRWYLPGVGRYLEPDPVAMGGSFNGPFGVDWYGYANQNPLRFTDRRGLYGTNDCSYYQDACLKYGGKYYCEDAPTWCDRFRKPPDPDPDHDDDYEGWSRCTRQCLQDCDALEHKDDNQCKASPDNRNGPWDLRYWEPENRSFSCHAACYSWCFAPIGLGDPNLPLRKNPFK